VQDVNGNVLLDLSSMENQPLGHNHAAFLKAGHNKDWDPYLINSGLAADSIASGNFAERVQNALSSVAPKGLPAVTLTEGRSAVEHGIYEAMWERGSDNKFTALDFNGSFHGNSLVLTQFAHPNMSMNSLGWPSHEYPSSQSEESQALEQIRASLQEKRAAGSPVAAVVIEPTNWQTGHSVSEGFINELKRVANAEEAALIVDETNTGCGASGQGFWQYNGPADYVAFGKRSQVTGFFSQH